MRRLRPGECRAAPLRCTRRSLTAPLDSRLSQPLYTAAAKFNSGCGWPAFDKILQGSVVTETDLSMGMRRVEIMCSACGGHLGHVSADERTHAAFRTLPRRDARAERTTLDPSVCRRALALA